MPNSTTHSAFLRTPAAVQAALPLLDAGGLIRVAVAALWLLVLRVPATLRIWYQRWQQRAHLDELDDRLLRDVGLTRDQVRRECAKWFWQP